MILRMLPVLALLFGLVCGRAHAEAPPAPSARLDAAKGTIEGVEARLARGDASDQVLQDLKGEIDPVVGAMAALAFDLAPHADAAKARLEQLGPKPGAKDPVEAADISTERASQEKLFNELDATVKRARVLSVQAAQISEGIVARRRSAFAHALFARSYSLASPGLWIPVARELPSDGRALRTLAQDWIDASLNKLSRWQAAGLGVSLLLICALYYPVWRLALAFRARRADVRPTRLGKALAALRVAVATCIVPIAALAALVGVADAFDLPKQVQSLGTAAIAGIVIVALATGLARGLLAPKSPNWRLPPVTDEVAKELYHLTITLTAIVALARIADALAEFIAVALPTAVATRGLGTLAVALAVLAALRKAQRRRGAARESVRKAPLEYWVVLLRLIGWSVVILLVGAVLIGYVAFGAFVVEQIVAVAGTLSLLYLVLVIAEDGIGSALRPSTALGRGLTAVFRFRAETLEQIAIVLSGIARVSLYVAAAVLLLAPWRIESGDMLATLQAAFFGFSVGGISISLSATIAAISFFMLTIAATRALQSWLDVKLLPRTRLDPALRNSIKTSLGYLGFTIALAWALSFLGLSFERLTLVAGGLSLGIGLGLQSVTNNFVSGLILLWERAIRVGDWISVGDEQGYVRRINVRSTEIETFDRALVIMPNSNLVTGIVKNWVLNDRVGRLKLPFSLPLTADPEQVRTVLIGTARAHDLVLPLPVAQAFFTGMTDTALRFELVCFIEDVEASIRVTSDLLFEIHARFRAAGLVQPPAPPVVSSPALDKLDAWLSGKLGETAASRPSEA